MVAEAVVEGPAEQRVRGLRCRYCGAPLPPVAPDAAVVVCTSCGRPNWLRGEGRLLVVPARRRDEAAAAFEELARRDPDLRRVGPVVARVEVVYIPFYEASGVGEAWYDYRGYVVRRRTVRRGDRWETVEERRSFHVSGTLTRGFRGLLLGRRVVGEPAVDELAERLLATGLSAAVEADRVELEPGVTVLAAELEPGEAGREMRGEAVDWLRGVVEAHVRSMVAARYGGGEVHVTQRRIVPRIRGFSLRGPLLAPLAKVFYVVEGKVYRAFFSGWDLAPLMREEPFTTAQRFAVAALGGLVGGGVGAAIAAQGDFLAAVIGTVIGAGLGYLIGRAGLREARIEEGGAQSWIESLPETIGAAVGRG